MQILYTGNTGFLLKGAAATVALECEPSKIAEADVVVNSSENKEVRISKEQSHFDWPGEYEARGVAVAVIPVGKTKPAHVAKIVIDEIAILHLDKMSETLTEAEEDKIGRINILLVNADKTSELSLKELQSIIEALEPNLVIPMNYTAGAEIEFAKQLGFGDIQAEDSIKLKKSDLSTERTELRILRAKK